MKIDVSKKNAAFFQCFSSESKLYIIELLRESPKNIRALATQLGVSSTIITRHINALEKAGLVESTLLPAKRGQQKICSLALDTVSLDFSPLGVQEPNAIELHIPVGQFSGFKVKPTCGLASTTQYIGMVDDPRYFSSPEAANAGIVWFESGHIDYTLPSYLFDHIETISAITISLEICSEYPKFKNDHPSDIVFSMNDQVLGLWTSPGSFGGKKGLYTPKWFECGTEYGLLKHLKITPEGTYVDGQKISTVTLKDLTLNHQTNQVLRIASPEDVAHPGGVTIFGKGYGNHNQDIHIRVAH